MSGKYYALCRQMNINEIDIKNEKDILQNIFPMLI